MVLLDYCATTENDVGDVLTLSIWSPLPLENDQSSCYKTAKSGFEIYNPTIFELGKNHLFVDHEKHALCDGYIVEFIHDATENYYERGEYGCRNFYGIKTPLYMLKVLKLFLLHLPALVALYLNDLFYWKIPMHRKWVRLKCMLPFSSCFYSHVSIIKNLMHSSKALKKSTSGR